MSDSRPQELPANTGNETSTAASAAAPSLAPPQAVDAEGGAVTVWNNDKRVSGLWGINENRNSWAYITGVGWKKLANNSDSAVVALTMLAAHAKQTQTTYTYRDEADGMIHESYVW